MPSANQASSAPTDRPTWREYFESLTYLIASRATCTRRKVGAVIVDPTDNHIISTGYNGSLPGQLHCIEEGVGCQLVDGHCVRTIHAEMNAILQAARRGVSLKGAMMYCNVDPCHRCRQAILGSGIESIISIEPYEDVEIKVESRG